MDLEYVKELIALLEKSKLSKLVIREKNGVEISLEKDQKPPPPPMHAPKEHVEHKPMHPEPPKMKGSFPQETKKVEKEPTFTDADCIKSPMIGTFYRSESPDAKPFKQSGDSVAVGDVLCIIEAMKVMNEIKSDKEGVLQEILVKDASPVEYGQQLFVIK